MLNIFQGYQAQLAPCEECEVVRLNVETGDKQRVYKSEFVTG